MCSFTSRGFTAPSLVFQATRRSERIEENSSCIRQQPCPPPKNRQSRWQMKFKAMYFCCLPWKMTCPIALPKPKIPLLSEMASGYSPGFPSVSSGGYPQQYNWKETKSRSHLCCNELHSNYACFLCILVPICQHFRAPVSAERGSHLAFGLQEAQKQASVT